MFKKSLIALALATATVSVHAYEFEKTVQVPVTVTKNSPGFTAGVTQKNVTINIVKLSETEKQALANRNTDIDYSASTRAALPPKVDLGMNNTPVLDQGRHGSCVTFATSAAVDAALGKGDYISQLCNLELGNHLEKNGYVYSGWEGSYGPVVLEQMMHFGVVSKETEKTRGCANVSEYPLKDASNQGNEMSLVDFKTVSEDLNKKIYWTHLYSNDQLFDWKTAPKDEMKKVLLDVKKQLANGRRLTFGTFLIMNDTCRNGACANYRVNGDTWVLMKGLETPPYEVGGHEMVIYGYDDNAVAYDKQGGQHKGLLYLRNSWGNDAGDNGNYYMSYDFFVKYANEVQNIVPLK